MGGKVGGVLLVGRRKVARGGGGDVLVDVLSVDRRGGSRFKQGDADGVGSFPGVVGGRVVMAAVGRFMRFIFIGLKL